MPCGGSDGCRAIRLLRGLLLVGGLWFVAVQIRLSVPNATLLAHETEREAAHLMRLILAPGKSARVPPSKRAATDRRIASSRNVAPNPLQDPPLVRAASHEKSTRKGQGSPSVVSAPKSDRSKSPPPQASPSPPVRREESKAATDGTAAVGTTPATNVTTSVANATAAPAPPLAATAASVTAAEKASPSSSYDWSRVKGLDLPPSPFHRYKGAVVATKVMGPDFVSQLKQMLCLFTAAYNRHVNYDVVVFTTLPWDAERVAELQAIIPDTKLTVALEGPPLEERLANLTAEERDYLHRRCKVPPGGQLTWYHFCSERPDSDVWTVRLSYAWQAEFRAYHLWRHPALHDYQYMLWMDSDAICSRPWDRDPLQLLVENDLVLLFDNIPGDFAENRELLDKMQRAYGRTVCEVSLGSEGTLVPIECTGKEDEVFVIPLVHGFQHITNLDFYRSSNASRFLEILVESQPYSREWDDQMGVTLPAVMEAPERSWDLRSHNVTLGIFHNGNLDGKPQEIPVKDESYTTFWNEKVRHQWKAAREMCDAVVVHTGRR